MSRKIYCLLLAFVLLLSVSCVAASDANQTADTLTQADEIDSIQEVTYKNTILNESTPQTSGEQYTMDLKTNIDDYGSITANITVNESVTGNITFSINDSEKEIYNQNVEINNGLASFSGYTVNASGNYTVTAAYIGDANLTSKILTDTFPMITRSSPNLEIVSKIIDDMGNINVNVSVKREAIGNITLSFNDTEEILEIVNGTAILENYRLEKGNYTIQAYYDGDRSHFKAVKNDTLNVEKSTTDLTITALISETGMMDVGADVNENATGNIEITITDANGTVITSQEQTAINGTITIDPIFTDNNTYTINATYKGDENYYMTTNTTKITTTKKQTNMYINIVKIDEYGNITVNVKINENVTGTITLTFNDKEETLEIINGTAKLENYKLAKGNYTITATCPGDENYYKAIANEILNVTKNQADLEIQFTNVGALGDILVVMTIDENATGNITLTFNNTETSVPIANGTATLNDYKLPKGNYTITATYPENENYYKATTNSTIEINKNTPEININIQTDEYGTHTITTTINKNATQNITLQIIGNTTYKKLQKTITNGTATFENITLPKDNYTIIATYTGDENYYEALTNTTLNVTKSQANLEIQFTNVGALGDILVVMTIDENATGNITLTFNNTETSVPIANGTATLNDYKLPKGNYTITATYPENENYYKATTNSTIEINKNTPEININIQTDEYGTHTITTTINKNATQNITLQIIGNTTYKKLQKTITNGTATFENITLPKDNYTIIATYTGDKNYYEALTNTTLNVTKSVTDLESIATVYDNMISIETTITNTTTGNVTYRFLLNGTEVMRAVVPINGTDASYNDTQIFQKGNYTIIVEYAGDENYYMANATVNATIAKNTPEITITVTTDEYGITTITANATASGNVTIELLDSLSQIIISANDTYTGQIVKGNYTIRATYPENDEYFSAVEYKEFEIAKSFANITATVTVNDNIIVVKAEITNSTTGNVTYTFLQNGTVIKEAVVTINGTDASYTEEYIFQKGNYTIFIEYQGDENYFKTNATANATIAKITPEITITVIADEYGRTTITANANVSGNITLEVLNVTVNNTYTGQFAKGNYTITASYAGDEENFPTTKTSDLLISKGIPVLDAIVTLDDNIVSIETLIDANATGSVRYIFYINGTAVREETSEISNGTSKFTGRFAKGEYDIFIEYMGDDNFFRANTTANASIDKNMPEITYTVKINGKNALITINIENATGIVEYSSATDAYNKTLSDGSAIFNGTYPAGYNTVSIRYFGDDYYFKTSENITFFIKQSTTVKAKSISVVYATNGKTTVTLTGENGPISNATVQIVFNGKTYKGKTNANGKVAITVSGKVVSKAYTCTVKFNGDNTSLASSSKFKITVKKATPVIVAPKKTYKVSTKTKKYTIALKNHKNAVMKNVKVTLKVNGKTYKATTNTQGKATFKITNLKKSAKFIALIKYGGNTNYNAVSKKVILTVKR